MSYDIRLQKDGESVTVNKHEEGGTYVMGGTDSADLNITYNYGWFYYKFLDSEQGIRWLYGKQAKDCIERLEKAVKEIGEDIPTYEDYWAPTPGNAVHALKILLDWAKQYPDAIFEGD